MNEYITNQGEFWDLVALRAYNEEAGQFLMSRVIEANIWGREIEQFSGGLAVTIPPAELVTRLELVPWKEAALEIVPALPARDPIYLGSFETLEDLPRIGGPVRAGDFAYIRRSGQLVQARAIP